MISITQDFDNNSEYFPSWYEYASRFLDFELHNSFENEFFSFLQETRKFKEIIIVQNTFNLYLIQRINDCIDNIQMKLSNLALQCIEDIDFRTIETDSNKNARSATKSRSRSTRKKRKSKSKSRRKRSRSQSRSRSFRKSRRKVKVKRRTTGGYKSENVKTKEISNINDAFSQIIYNIKLQNETLPENEKLYNCY